MKSFTFETAYECGIPYEFQKVKKQYYIDQAVPQILIFGVLVSELPQVPDDAALEHIVRQEMP